MDKKLYEEKLGEIVGEIHFPLPCYPDEAEQIFKFAWEAQQQEIDRLLEKLSGQGKLFDAVINQKVITAAENLIHLHLCEQEGISSGMPTPEDWEEAVDRLHKALENCK